MAETARALTFEEFSTLDRPPEHIDFVPPSSHPYFVAESAAARLARLHRPILEAALAQPPAFKLWRWMGEHSHELVQALNQGITARELYRRALAATGEQFSYSGFRRWLKTYRRFEDTWTAENSVHR